MQNFDYQTPTRLIFGKGVVEQLPEVMGQFGKRILLTYGAGSIKKLGLYDKVKELLKDFEIFELSGIQPNPKYDPSVLNGVKICKENDIDVILAVGGGSVLDCSKAIATGAKYDGDPWDFFDKGIVPEEVLPIGVIATTASSGSETSNCAILSSGEWKLGFEDDRIIPKFAIMDPRYTSGLPPYQTFAGIADVLSHLLERYFSDERYSDTTDRLIEGAVNALLVNAERLLKDPSDLNARGEIQWLASVAHNNFLDAGRRADWGSHRIEHELSAQYDITHGEGMAIVLTAWTKYAAARKPWRLALLASRVFGTDSFDYSEEERAFILSEKLSEFFKRIGLKTTLGQLGIDERDFDVMAERATRNGAVGHYLKLDREAVKDILKTAL